MPAKTAPREHAKAMIDRSIRRALAPTYSKPRKTFLRLLTEIRGRSDLLRPARFQGRIDLGWLDAILGAILALTDYRRDWLRPVEAWEPAGSNPIRLFSSLAHHLLAEYPVPPVLLSGWFLGPDWDGRRQRRWFLRAGAGFSLRVVGFPIDLTRRMAHELAQAPVHYPVPFALRWAQVRGLGGSDSLARTVAATRLGRRFGDDEFWVTLIHFLINHPKFDLARVDAVVEYLQDQKFEEERAIIGEATEVDLDPPQPDLSLKGWTPASLLRRVAEWQARRPVAAAKPRKTLIRWDRSAVGEYLHIDRSGQTWTIRELLDSDALAAEGEAMDHCVATYTAWCSKRLSTIWSVGIEGPQGRERAATVEVNPANRQVVQSKARSNESPDAACLSIVRQWADREALGWEV